MARELPRTLRSLTAGYQRGIAAGDYEVIVVDNGSPEPIDPDVLDRFPGELRHVRVDPAPPTPARAANLGIEMAQAEFVGLLIDGARITSPGLLARAVQARALVGPTDRGDARLAPRHDASHGSPGGGLRPGRRGPLAR